MTDATARGPATRATALAGAPEAAQHRNGHQPPKPAAPRKPPALAIGLAVLTALLLSLAFLAAAWRTETMDREAESTAIAGRAEILSRLFASHVERTFRQADVLARLVGDSYLNEGPRLDLQRVVREGTIPIDFFLQVAVVDERGTMVASSLPGSQPVDLSDRAHIRVHLDRRTAPDFHISQPLVGRVSNRPTIQYTRSILDGAGRFRGVAVVSVAPGYFGEYFAQRDLGQRGVIAVFGTEDRIVRARKSGADESAGQQIPASDPILMAAARHQAGVIEALPSAVDAVVRTYGYAPVAGFPLGVAVGLDVTAEMQRHRDRVRQVWLRTLAAIGTTLLLTIANLYVIRRWAISSSKQAKAELRGTRLANRLSTMTDASPDGLLLVNSEDCVEEVNPAFSRMAGSTPPAVVGTPAAAALRLLAAHRGAELPEDLEELLARGDRFLAVRSATPPAVYEIRGWPVTDQDAKVISVRDITAEHEIQRMKSEFVATAAHELRTPMASVLGFSELLLADGLSPAERHEAAQAINRQASRLTALLNDFLDLARVEARAGLDFRFAEVDLVELVRHVVDEFRYVALDRVVDLDTGALDQLLLRADAAKLAQVVHNLLSNALKYSAAPAPIIVRLDVDGARGNAVVDVIDAGIGMTPAQLERVFDGFYRADPSGQTVGSGLGLRLARRIVEVHGGTIQLKSAPGRGTTARVRLVLNPVDAA